MDRSPHPWEAGVTEAGTQQLAYLRTGGTSGATIVLLHGWPQSSWAWRDVIPRLDGFDVIAFDLPGIGGSSPSEHGYDKRVLASSVLAGLRRLGVEDRVTMVGHDFGAMVAYAFARMFPASTSALLILDQAIPGVDGWLELGRAFASWHLGFHRDLHGTRGLAEQVIVGHEATYFRRHIDRFAAQAHAVSDRDVEIYAAAYRPVERLHAGFEMFRTLPIDAEANATDSRVLAVPTLLAFGQHSQATLLGTVGAGLTAVGVARVSTTVIEDCGHWAPEEQPGVVAALIRDLDPARGR